MSTKEEKEFEELAVLEEFEAQESDSQKKREFKASPELAEEQGIDVSADLSAMESAALGFIEGVPFAKDAVAVKEMLMEPRTNETEMGLDDIYKHYKDERRAIDDAINQAQTDHPFMAGLGDVAGGLTSVAAIGPAALGLSGAIGMGAVSGYSRSEERLLVDGLAGGVLGAAFHGFGVGVGKGFTAAKGYVKRKLGMVSVESVKEAMSGGVSQKGIKTINEHLGKSGQSAEDFAESFFNMELDDGAKLMVEGQPYAETLKKVGLMKEKTWNVIGKVLGKADDVLPDGVDPKNIYNRLLSEIVEPMQKSGISETVDAGNQLLAKLNREFIVDFKTFDKFLPNGSKVTESLPVFDPKWSLSKLHNYAKGLSKVLYAGKRDPSTAANLATGARNQVNGVVRNVVGETVEAAERAGEAGILNAFKGANKNYGNLTVAEKLLTDAVNKQSLGPLGHLQEAVNMKGLVLGAGVVGATGMPKPLFLPMAFGINRLLKSQSLPQTWAVGMKRIASKINTDPNHPALYRIMTAAGMTADKFRTAVAGAIGQFTLEEDPVKRNVMDVKRKSASIMAALDSVSPDLATQFSKLLTDDNDSDIAAFIDGISKQPDVAKLIDSGIGIDGKVFSDEDKAILENEVKASAVSLSQKLEHLEGIRRSGTIPQIEKDEPYKVEHIARDKSKHRY